MRVNQQKRRAPMINKETALIRIKDALWVMFVAGMTIGVGRFVFGLGAATNMTDLLPWGFWKVFNMVAGAALATSGFVVAAIIYIFQLEKFKPVARFSIIIGFLGYGSSLFALLFDIGLPHRGWHPFFMWNPHSFLFEVFWCVSVYWSITAFELVPLITERFPFPKVTHFLHEIMLPVVILGITLSTLHHSSLGSLFMASPTRLHPLWYSLWIPPEFFISAMGAGLSVIVLLKLFFSWLYNRDLDLDVLRKLVIGSAGFLLLYLIIKIADFTVNRKWNFVFGPDITWESVLFWVEILFQVLIPVAVFLTPALRNRVVGLIAGTAAASIGLIMHRLNTGIVGYFRSAESIYIPNLSEFLLSFGILAGAGLLFFLLVERFYIFREPKHSHDSHDSGAEIWTKDEAVSYFSGKRLKKVIATFVIVIPATWLLFGHQATGPYEPIAQPVKASVIGMDAMRETLKIDGNLNGDFVEFPHKKHQDAFIGEYGTTREQTCETCHHLNLPNDNNSNCRLCHSDMKLEVSIFSAENHAPRFKTEKDPVEYLGYDLENRWENYLACSQCHVKGDQPMKGLEEYSDTGFSHQAPGFEDSMHGSCQTCHRQREKDPTDPMSEGNCLFCHKQTPLAQTF